MICVMRMGINARAMHGKGADVKQQPKKSSLIRSPRWISVSLLQKFSLWTGTVTRMSPWVHPRSTTL